MLVPSDRHCEGKVLFYRFSFLFSYTVKSKASSLLLIVVAQSYEVEADNEYVIRGNSAVMKCEVPSFVSDFVTVENWQDSQGNTFLPGTDYGNSRGCLFNLIFFVSVSLFHFLLIYISIQFNFYQFYPSFLSAVVQQFYQSHVVDEFVLRGNTAILKCLVPSFVTDFVMVDAWVADDGKIFNHQSNVTDTGN